MRPTAAFDWLSGRIVLQLADGIAGRYCGRLLAQLGAEVVEARPEARDDNRIGFAGAAGRAFGRWLDDGKRLIPTVGIGPGPYDLVISGPDAGDVDAAAALLPTFDGDPVLIAITWFHLGGPYATWSGGDELIHALSGVAFTFGTEEGPPTLPQGHGPQIMAGAQAANLGMAALLADPGQRPGRVDVDVLETALCLSEVGAVGAIDDPSQRTKRFGVNRHSPTYPCSSYRTADGWVGVTCLTPPQWQSMCDLIGRPDIAAEPRYRTSFRRLLLADEVDAVLAAGLADRTTEQWVRLGIQHRIPIAPMPHPSELPEVPHWRDRGGFAPSGDGEVLGPTLPFTAREHPASARSRTAVAALPGPLSGVRVVDFTMGWAGPQATRFLADLGADVIKVESSAHPDWYRGWEADQGGDPPAIELRASFNTLNRNKRGVVIDLTSAAGRAQAEQLIVEADVVIENFAAGVLDRLGLAQELQRRLSARVVSLSMPAFGNGGPLSGIRAYGSTVEQASGLPFVNGEANWPPSLQHVAYGDAVAGIFAATAMLGGLHAHDRGHGVDIDLAQVACLFELGADAIIAEQLASGPLRRTGSARSRLVRCEVLRCHGDDAWVAIATRDVDLLPDDVAGWVANRTPGDAAAELQALGVPAAPVLAVDALGDDPHLTATGFWQTMERRYVGRHAQGAPPFRLDGRRPDLRVPAPTLGEHTTAIFGGTPPWQQ